MDTRLLEELKEKLNPELHFFERCDALAAFRMETKLSERDLSKVIGKSKSEVHRMLNVARTPEAIRMSVLEHGTDYHVLVRMWQATPELHLKLIPLIMKGEIKRHKEINSFLYDFKPSVKEKLQRKHDLLERQLKKCKMELEKVA